MTRLSPKGNFTPHHPPNKVLFHGHFYSRALHVFHAEWAQFVMKTTKKEEKEKIFLLFNRKRHWERNKRCPENNGWILLQRVDWNFRFSSRLCQLLLARMKLLLDVLMFYYESYQWSTWKFCWRLEVYLRQIACDEKTDALAELAERRSYVVKPKVYGSSPVIA